MIKLLMAAFVASSVSAGAHAQMILGDNPQDAITRWGGTRMPLLMLDRSVNWSSINDNTVADFTVITPVNSTSNQYASFNSRFVTGNTSFNYNHLVGFEDQHIYTGTGTLAEDWSFLSLITLNGPVTARRAVYINDFAGTGSVATQYGVYVNSLTKAAVNYAFFSAGTTPSSFGGDVLIGITTAPAMGDTGNGTRITAQGNGGLYGYVQLLSDTTGIHEMGRFSFGSPAYSGSDKRTAVLLSTSTDASTANPKGDMRFYTNPGGALALALTINPDGTAVHTNKVTATGYAVGASNGLSVTKTVRAAGGASDCTLVYTGGLLTGGTC